MIGLYSDTGLSNYATLDSKTMKLALIGPFSGDMGPVDVLKNAAPMFNVIASDDFLSDGQPGVIGSCFKTGFPWSFTSPKKVEMALVRVISPERAIVGLISLCINCK